MLTNQKELCVIAPFSRMDNPRFWAELLMNSATKARPISCVLPIVPKKAPERDAPNQAT